MAAKLYNIELCKVYSYKGFLAELLDKHREYEEKYNELKKNVGDIFIHIKSKKNRQEILNSGMGLCLFMDIVTSQPKYSKMGIVDRFLNQYKEAGEAMVELLNYMK